MNFVQEIGVEWRWYQQLMKCIEVDNKIYWYNRKEIFNTKEKMLAFYVSQSKRSLQEKFHFHRTILMAQNNINYKRYPYISWCMTSTVMRGFRRTLSNSKHGIYHTFWSSRCKSQDLFTFLVWILKQERKNYKKKGKNWTPSKSPTSSGRKEIGLHF